MLRKLMIGCFLAASALATSAHASDKGTYKMTATATRDASGITIALKLTSESVDDNGMHITSEQSSPAIKIREGQEAILMIGSAESDPGDHAKAPDYVVTVMTTGVKISVFSVKGEDTVLVVGASFVKGMVIWDDAQRIAIRSKP